MSRQLELKAMGNQALDELVESYIPESEKNKLRFRHYVDPGTGQSKILRYLIEGGSVTLCKDNSVLVQTIKRSIRVFGGTLGRNIAIAYILREEK